MGNSYIAAIKPFRHLLGYPAAIRQIERTWRAVSRSDLTHEKAFLSANEEEFAQLELRVAMQARDLAAVSEVIFDVFDDLQYTEELLIENAAFLSATPGSTANASSRSTTCVCIPTGRSTNPPSSCGRCQRLRSRFASSARDSADEKVRSEPWSSLRSLGHWGRPDVPGDRNTDDRSHYPDHAHDKPLYPRAHLVP